MSSPEVQLNLTIAENGADDERLDNLTVQLMGDLKELDLESIERPVGTDMKKGAKGDPFTLGALILVAVPAVLPPLIGFLESWAVERRKVSIEAPNGVKLEFVPEKRFSQAELLAFVERVSQIPSPVATA
jgi:hypothetical protein